MQLKTLRSKALEAVDHVTRAGDEHTESLFLGELAAVISCWAYGHPNQPGAKAKYRENPWRCARCETWWVTYKYTDYAVQATQSFEWRWKQVKPCS